MTENSKMKLIDIDDVPNIDRGRRDWLAAIKEIPEGKAWVVKEGELPISVYTVKIIVSRAVQRGDLPATFVAVQRKGEDGKRVVYVIHRAESQ